MNNAVGKFFDRPVSPSCSDLYTFQKQVNPSEADAASAFNMAVLKTGFRLNPDHVVHAGQFRLR